MTTIYFIRHAQSDQSIINDSLRPLTQDGVEASVLLIEKLANIPIDVIISSPYKRSRQTLMPLAESRSLTIFEVEDFRERKITDGWIEDFKTYARSQWQDFDYCLDNGESLRQVQQRNITALIKVINDYKNQTIVIGTHGTALSLIINYFIPKFGFSDFMQYVDVMPWVVMMTFEEELLTSIKYSI